MKDKTNKSPPAPPRVDILIFEAAETALQQQDVMVKPIEEWVAEAKIIYEKYGSVLDYSRGGPDDVLLNEAINVMEGFIRRLHEAQGVTYDVGRAKLLNKTIHVKSEMELLKRERCEARAENAFKGFSFFGFSGDWGM
jgi:hypothetical protein